MLITNKEILKKYSSEHRVWQGVASIAHTRGGKTFVAFYSGNITETFGNYVVLVEAGNDLKFGEPIAVIEKPGKFRCFDSVLWIDPLGRLWITWSCMPGEQLWGAICNNPDEELVFGEEFYIGRGVMMNKPTVLTSGEWLFPIAFWTLDKATSLRAGGIKEDDVPASYVYRSCDNGKTFEKIGGSMLENRDYDEHKIVENLDGTLSMYVRAKYGIGVCTSNDRGVTWSKGEDSGLGGPNSRFFISRLRSGRILLINHVNFTGRTNLTLMLSEDDGKTYPYSLTLDERHCSYPDAQEADDGFIYVVYDRERGGECKSLEEVYKYAREITLAKITENDIISGKLVNKYSRMKLVVSKLGELSPNDPDPYADVK